MNTSWFRGWSARLRCCPSSPTLVLGIAFCLGLAGPGCGRTPPGQPTNPNPKSSNQNSPRQTIPLGYHIDLPKVEARGGTAVVILVDTSGSMEQSVPDGGKRRAKYLIAKDALQHIIDHTAQWKKEHSSSTLQMGIFHFSSGVAEVLPMGDFDQAKAQQALGRIGHPNGGTAIGRAMEEGAKALYRSGCTRKFLVCITDGENTSGIPPDRVARQLFQQTGGEVAMEFVAFDTSANHFRFLKEVKGNAVEASSGEQLQAELGKIYKSKILAEAPEPPK